MLKARVVSKGFDNWKKVKEHFGEHECCEIHREVCMKLQLSQQPSVATHISHQFTVDQKHKREMLMKVLTLVRLLCTSGSGYIYVVTKRKTVINYSSLNVDWMIFKV